MKKIIIFLFYSSVCYSANAQFNWIKQWDHRYGGTNGDYVMDFLETSDAGFLLVGRSNSDSSGNKATNLFGSGPFDYWVIKVDQYGILQWEKNFQASGNEWLWSVNKTFTGGFIIGGWSDSPVGGDKSQPSQGGQDYWILKLDANGNKIWDRTYGGTDDDELRCVIPTLDGGFLLGGNSHSGIGGDKTEAKFGINDYWVVKIDSAGMKQWDKVYGGPGYEQYRVSIQTPDKGFLHGGQSSSGVGGNKTDVSQGGIDYWLVKTDSLGTIQWDSAYGGSGDDNFQAMIKTTGGSFMLGGWSTSGISGDKTQPSNGQYDLWLLKINSQGGILWDKDFGGTGIEDEFSSIFQTIDGGYLLGATSYSGIGGDKSDGNLGVEQPWLLKIDQFGNKLWDKTIFTLGHNEGGNSIQTSERNCYVIVTGDNGLAGGDKSEDAWGGFSSDYWIVKYCEESTAEINNLTINNNDLLVYPNPFLNELKIKLVAGYNNTIAAATLYDVIGNKIIFQQFNIETTLNTSGLAKGMYILDISVDGKSARRKIIK